MLQPNLLKLQLYFQALMFLENRRQKELVSTLCNFNTGMHVACPFHFMIMAWTALTRQLD